VKLSEIDPGRAVTISGEGKGGAAGFAKGGAKVRMEPVPEGTQLSYDVEANVGGKIAQLGSRLIEGFAKKMADEFFTRFQDAVEGPEAAEEEVAADTGVQKKGWFKRLIGA
jgi:carbon monoxide dehydrogenase subunit G